MLYIVAAAAYIPSALFAPDALRSGYFFLLASVALPVVGILLCVRMIGAFKPMLHFSILTLLVFFLLGSPVIAAIVPILFTVSTIFACLVKELRSPALPLLFVLSYGIAYFITKGEFLSSLALIPLPMSYAIYYSFKKKQQRVGSVCRISAVLGATVVIYLLAWIYLRDGSITPDMLKSFFTALREGMTAKFAEALTLASSQIAEEAISLTYATEFSELIMSSLFNLLPAIFVIILFIISYIAHSLYISLMSATEKNSESLINAMIFKMSTTSAVVFIITFLATLILSELEYALYATAAQNICIIFQPGLILIAFAFLSGMTKSKNASCLGQLVYFAVIGMLFYIPSIILTIASFAGAVIVILNFFKSRKNKIK